MSRLKIYELLVSNFGKIRVLNGCILKFMNVQVSTPLLYEKILVVKIQKSDGLIHIYKIVILSLVII